jgi:hypothetical protein
VKPTRIPGDALAEIKQAGEENDLISDFLVLTSAFTKGFHG